MKSNTVCYKIHCRRISRCSIKQSSVLFASKKIFALKMVLSPYICLYLWWTVSAVNFVETKILELTDPQFNFL